MAKKKKKKQKDTHPQSRGILFNNYDYSDVPSGPGAGLYNGNTDKYKSVGEFLEKSRKRLKQYKGIGEKIK